MRQNQNYISHPIPKAARRVRTAARTPGDRGGAAPAVVQMTYAWLAAYVAGCSSVTCGADISYSATGSFARTRSTRRAARIAAADFLFAVVYAVVAVFEI